ncbi:MAG: hypothetical protein IKN42_05930 [Elusimicrobia bacterium]|nr:hypothetical protein [Elusimicrobiota bacterium]
MENSKVEEKVFNEIKRKFKEKGYDNVIEHYSGYGTNNNGKTKINIDFLSVDKNTKIPLLAFELKRVQSIKEIRQPKKYMFEEVISSIKHIRNIYKDIKYLEFYLIIVDNNINYKIFEVNIKGEYKQVDRIDDILNKSNKTINTYISGTEKTLDKIKFFSKIFIYVFSIFFIALVVLSMFYSNIDWCCIKYLIITLLIIYGLCIIPYIKEINLWGLRIRNFDMDK